MGLQASRADDAQPVPDERTSLVANSIDVLGVRVDNLNLVRAVQAIDTAIATGRRGYVCVTGVHGVMESTRDPQCQAMHNRACLVTPDGMPLVWLLRLAGYGDADRVYGPDLMLAVFEQGCTRGYRHFLYGAEESTLQRLRSNLLQRVPQAQIVGSYAPPFRPLEPAEEAEVAARINASGADIVWVGLSTPKQEAWMARMRPRLEPALLIGVGAAFDFHAGLKPQAPRFIQRSGLEWLFRLACEPRRLWRRYLHNNPRFVMAVAAQMIGRRASR